MLNIFFKSAMYYTFFRKYGKKFALVFSIISFIVLVNFIYSDIVEYLTLNDMKENLIYALLTKWLLILIGIGSIIYIIKSAISSKEKPVQNKEVKAESETIKKPMSSIEKDIVGKDELKSHGDKLIEEMKARKKNA